MKKIIFLDIDGVLNCELFYKTNYKEAKKSLKKQVKKEEISSEEYYKSQLCEERISWLNQLCVDIGAEVVISSTWRYGRSVEMLQNILNASGATFKIIGITPDLTFKTSSGLYKATVRGNEIDQWLRDHEEIIGCYHREYKHYVIIDDDSDMLLSQREHFFQTDSYSGLTPNICHRIKIFLNS